MFDLAEILFSSIVMFMVILRAVQLDATTPWFSPPKDGPDSSGLRLRPNVRPAAPKPEDKPPAVPKNRWNR